MRTRILAVLAIAMLARASSSPDSVDDCNRITSSLSQKVGSEIKITEEKRIQKVEMQSEGSQQSTFSSHVFHEGHNLFFQPKILIGSGINASFLSSKEQDEKEFKGQMVTTITDSKKNEIYSKVTINGLPKIPKAPTLSPLVMPNLPTPVIVEDHVVIMQQKPPAPVREIIIEQDTVLVPELPAFIPLNPPRIPIEVILPKLPHIPTCLNNNNRYEITVPCAPIAVSSEIIGIQNLIVEKPMLVPETRALLNLRLPKIPLGVVYNKPVKTFIPYPDGFISTTRFLPSVQVSKIPLEKFSQQNLVSRTSDVIVGKAFPSFSAYCAHNIALQRILPNIVIGK